MDGATIYQWVGVIALALSAINMLWLMISRTAKGLKSKIEVHAENLKNHDRRIQAVEHEVAHLPTSGAFNEMKVTVARMEGHLERLESTLDTLKHTVNRIDDYLREAGK